MTPTPTLPFRTGRLFLKRLQRRRRKVHVSYVFLIALTEHNSPILISGDPRETVPTPEEDESTSQDTTAGERGYLSHMRTKFSTSFLFPSRL